LHNFNTEEDGHPVDPYHILPFIDADAYRFYCRVMAPEDYEKQRNAAMATSGSSGHRLCVKQCQAIERAIAYIKQQEPLQFQFLAGLSHLTPPSSDCWHHKQPCKNSEFCLYQWYSYKCHRRLVKHVQKEVCRLTGDLVRLQELKHKHEKSCRLHREEQEEEEDL
jgi:hypothetical protein